MPLNLWIYTKYWGDQQFGLDYLDILISMGFVTGPVILGMALRYKTRIWADRLSRVTMKDDNTRVLFGSLSRLIIKDDKTRVLVEKLSKV